jgi:hypothetical protein
MKNLSYTKKGPGRTHNYNRKTRTYAHATFEDQDQPPNFSNEDRADISVAQRVIKASRNAMESARSFVKGMFK